MTIQDHIAHRSGDVHWSEGLNPTEADLVARNEIVIHAARERILRHPIAASGWPSGYPNAGDVVVNDPSGLLADGVSFDWTTFELEISSTVAEFVPPARLGWYGRGEGLRAYHTWLLVPREHDTYVLMEGNRPRRWRQMASADQPRPHAPGPQSLEHQPEVPLRHLERDSQLTAQEQRAGMDSNTKEY